jgi:hypothetical protein
VGSDVWREVEDGVLKRSKLDSIMPLQGVPLGPIYRAEGLIGGDWVCGGVYLREATTTLSKSDHLSLLNTANTSTMEPAMKTCITAIRKTDFTEWSRLFHAYIDFYKSSIPEAQYQATFNRLIDPNRDLYGLVLRSSADENKLFGFSHSYPHQTPWAEKQIMHLNGMCDA